jgi:cytochrome c oxidase assembly protein subunit 11
VDVAVTSAEALVRNSPGGPVAQIMAIGPSRKRALPVKLAILAVAMFVFGFLLAPLYSVVCRLTGLNQLQSADSVAAGTRTDVKRTVSMQFDANLRDGLPWVFRPMQPVMQVHPGQLVRASYEASNTSDRAIVGQAVASFAPAGAAAYVRKLECFCFSSQTLAPHEVKNLPVVFMIDPALPRDVPTVTLSYTFFEVPGAGTASKRRDI